MKKIFLIIILGVFIHQASYSQTREIPIEDFFRNPEGAGYKISPDGKYIAYLAPYEKRLNLFVRDLTGQKISRLTSVTDRNISSFSWKDDKIIYLKDKTGDENNQLYVLNLDGTGEKDLTPFEKVRTVILDELDDNPGEILILMNKRNAEIFDVYRLNVKTGKIKMDTKNPGNISDWITDNNGKVMAATTTDGVNTGLLYRKDEKSPFKNVLSVNFEETFTPLFFTFDNKAIYAASSLGRDKSAIVKFDIENGKETNIIYEDKDVDLNQVLYSKKRKILTAVLLPKSKDELYYLDDETRNLFNRLEKDLGKYEIRITDNNREENKFIIRTYSDRTQGSYYLYDKMTDKLTELGKVTPWLNEDEMPEMKPISYKSRDGFTINGYLTLPLGKDPKNLPVVINPHGGPWSRDTWGFDPEVSFLANRGFAVLQVNFRGSTGYGKEFWKASFKEWGGNMQNDITDGVQWLIDQGIADPKKIGIYGASYGGYATLAGLTFTPGIYACGVDYVGVSNLFTFLNSIPPYWKPYLEMFHTMVGDPHNDSLLLYEKSPVFHTENIKAPLFIAQGKNDPRVNKNESDQMVEALKNRGVEVQYMVKDNEGHGFRNEENRIEFYEAMEKFFKKYLLNE